MKLFKDKLDLRVKEADSLLCVGLDSDSFKFNKEIIDKTHDLVCAYKPNTAFYEAQGEKGVAHLKMTCDYLSEEHPEIVIIIDAKRGDVENTNESYARFLFDYLRADAVTLHPYLGRDSLRPFLERKDKMNFILCRTSNKGAGEIQDLLVEGVPLYQIIAQKVAKDWNQNKNCGLVVGATYPEELASLRNMAPNLPFLIPGVGTQGGDLEKSVRAGVDKNGRNAIVSVSRSIIFAENSRKEAKKIRNNINRHRNE